MVAACGGVRALAPSDYETIDAIGFSAARETFALFDDELRPLTAGILWSDGRADHDAAALGDPAAFRAETGVVLNAASSRGEGGVGGADRTRRARPGALDPATARPRRRPHDRRGRHRRVARVAHGLVARSATVGSTVRSRPTASGCRRSSRPTPIVGALTDRRARALGLRADVRVIAGAGDRACEVLGSGASAHARRWCRGGRRRTCRSRIRARSPRCRPSPRCHAARSKASSWKPGCRPPAPRWRGWRRSPAAAHDDLFEAAAATVPGAGGVVVLPWFAGARGPWWRADAHAAFIGLTDAHGAGRARPRRRRGHRVRRGPLPRAHRARTRRARARRRGRRPRPVAPRARRRHRAAGGAARGRRRRVGRRAV